MDDAETELANALVAMVGGSRPIVSPTDVLLHLSRLYQVNAHQVEVCRSNPNDFLLIFSERHLADRVLLVDLPDDTPFMLLFRHWRQ
jgi:hypothetical protein